MTKTIQAVEQLEELLSEPTEPVVEIMRRLSGDMILLGAAGKIGPSLARMARRASDLAGVHRRVIGVSLDPLPEGRAGVGSRFRPSGLSSDPCGVRSGRCWPRRSWSGSPSVRS